MERYAIIVAGGTGTRFGGDTPKQFLEISGKPLLYYPMKVFEPLAHIILVLPHDNISLWNDLCRRYGIRISHNIIPGGASRPESVKNGLEAIPVSEGFVAIHDAVRPLVSADLAENAFLEAIKFGSAVPVVKVNDTIRKLSGNTSNIVDRTDLRQVQTPQVFDLKLITQAYQQKFDPSFTDDAALVEAIGHKVHYFQGEALNFKITMKEDLEIAKQLIS